MNKLILTTALTLAAAPVFAEECGEVSITEMNWASASVVTNVAKFLMEQGYGCEVKVVPSDTTPAITSLAENGEPDIVTEMWTVSASVLYNRLLDEGKIIELGKVLEPGGVEGWLVPRYLVDEHPELATLEGVMANPDLVGGVFNNCPDGWGCRIANDNLLRAFEVEQAGFEIFNHGSGETLATSLASAYESEEPWFGYYWAPTSLLGKYDMVMIDMGPYDEAAHIRNREQNADEPGRTAFPEAPVYTVVTGEFAESHPEISELMAKLSFKVDTMGQILAWMDENTASAEEGAVYFLTTYPEEWSAWLSDDARDNLSALLAAE